MLDFMRRNARSWVIKIALGIICIVFVFFMGGGGQIGGGGANVAAVGDIEISLPEYQLAYQRNQAYFRAQYGDKLTPEVIQVLDIPSQTLQQLVDAAALRQEAARIGLTVPDDAVRSAIREIDAFQQDGSFSPAAYRGVLRAQGLSPGAFEASMNEEILTNQLLDIIRRGAHVSDDEAFKEYLKTSRKLVLVYVSVSGADLEDEVTLDEAGLASYYEERREEFRRTQSVKVRYLAYKVEDLAEEIEVSDEDIDEYYILNEDEFVTEEKIGARHILKRLEAEADDETRAAARDAIDEIADRIEAGEDFAELAGAESDDPGSAARNGDLGTFERGKMVKPFENAAFALGVGEVSDVIETPFGFHIIKVYEKQEAGTLSLEQARDTVIEKVRKREAKEVVFDAAAEDAGAIADGATLEELAESRGVKLEQSPLFQRGEVIAGIGSAPDLIDAALALDNVGDTSDPVRAGKDFYILELAERRESYVPALDEVREAAAAGYRTELATQAARAKADEIVAELRAGSMLDEIAEERGLEVKETAPFDTRGRFVPGLGTVKGLKDVAFRTQEDGEFLPRPFVHRGDALVFERKSLEEGDRAGYEEVREERIEQLRIGKEQQAISSFLSALKEEIGIDYNEQMVAQLMGDSARR